MAFQMIHICEGLLTYLQWKGSKYKKMSGTAIPRYRSGSAGVSLHQAVLQSAVGTNRYAEPSGFSAVQTTLRQVLLLSQIH